MTGFATVKALAPFAALAVLTATALETPPAGAQTAQSRNAQQAAPASPPPEGLNDADCAKIPGGNAPVNIIARIQGTMSVENLEFTYFGKKLFQLTRADFEYLKRLIPYCRDQPTEQTNYIIDRLATLVLEAQETREKSIDWIKKTSERLDALPPTKESIEEVHNIWTELQNRRLEMTEADSRYLSKKVDDTRTRLYQEAESSEPNRQRQDPEIRVSPFLPETPADDRKPDPG